MGWAGGQLLEGKTMLCWICGKEATKTRDLAYADKYMILQPIKKYQQRCYCDECFKKVMDEMLADKREYVRLKKKMMFERAVNILEHQKMNIYKYQEAIKAVQEYAAENPDKFDSSYEMIAAIILIYHRIECKLQQKIGRYQVDFVLPVEHIILEIDGERHKHRKAYDSERDAFIKAELGGDWQIMRISTECLDMHANRLIKAINKLSDYRSFGYM